MKRSLMVFIMSIIFLPMLVNAKQVKKEEFTNPCENYKSGKCAFCVYEFNNNDQKEYHIKIALIYKSDESVIDNMYYYEKNTSAQYGQKINISSDIYKKDFEQNNQFGCPDIGYSKVANTDPTFRGQIWSISKDYETKLTPTSETTIVEGSETNDEEEIVYACDYDSFRIGLVDGIPKVVLKSAGSKEIKEILDASLFKNNNCPTVYSCSHGTGDYVTYTTTDPGIGSNYCTKHTSSIINMETGEKGENSDIELEEISNCTSLLGNPETPQSPAWYLSLIFKIMKYASIILIVVLTIMDFISAVASQDNDALKKATNKVVTRLILCVVLFVLPDIINFVLKFIHDSSVTDCIKNIELGG